MENETTIPVRTGKRTILILEDQRGFRKVYRDLLESEDYEVLEAADGEEGWDVITTQKPDLVLLDLGLPLVDGFQILEKMRRSSQTKQIPVIIFSVLGEPRDVKKAMEMGANDYSVKGFYTPRQILSKIKGLLKDTNLQSGASSYRYPLQANPSGTTSLETDLGLGPGFHCPHCHTAMEMEFFPDFARADGHWFTARFLCPSCQKPF